MDWVAYGNNIFLREEPFNEDTMEVVTKLIPYQDNSCDCGVFVCRYAYALFESRFDISYGRIVRLTFIKLSLQTNYSSSTWST